MKLLGLFCLVGLAAASISSRGGLGSEGSIFNWDSGKTYVFKYKSRQVTGFPGLATEYSGLGLECNVNLAVQSTTKFSLSVKECSYVRISDKLHSTGTDDSKNWRFIELPTFSTVPEEFARYLEIPTVFNIERETGEFKSLTVSGDEPEWCINYKKALVSLVQTKIQDSRSAVETNRIESGKETNTFWRVKEESVDGVCEVMYQLNEIPAYMIKDLPRVAESEHNSRILDSMCQEDGSFYELVKTKDVNSCEKRSSFSYYKPGHFRCPTGNCDGMWSRSSITRYIACGEVSNLKVVSIQNEGELYQNLMGINTENILTGTRQVMKLTEVKSGAQIQEPSNPIVLKSLLYSYKLKNKLVPNGDESEINEIRGELTNEKWAAIAKTLPRNVMVTGGDDLKNDRPVKEIKEQIKKLIIELIEKDLFSYENVAEKQITMKTLNLARGFSLLTKEDIESVYEELKSHFGSEHTKKETLKNVFFDTLLMAGLEHNVMVVKKYIRNGEISKVQSASLLMSMPHYIITPTHKVLEEIYELVTSSEIKEKSYVYNHAVMSFTVLLEKACVADNRKTSYPTFVMGEFCHPDSDIVVNKWIPFLQKELRDSSSLEKKNMIIVTLGLLSHRNVLPILVPVIEGTAQGTPLNRFLAIYSLANAGRRNPNLAIPIVFAVFSNRAERTETRIAAFNTLMKLNPPMAILHKIAASTWSESDKEVLKVVFTAIYSLKEQRELEPMRTTSMSMQRKAAVVFPMMKAVKGVFPTSATLYTSDYLKDLNIGFQGVYSWTSSKDSILPSELYTKMVYMLDRYQFTPLQIGARFKGVETIVEELLKVVVGSGVSSVSGGEGVYGQLRESLSAEWKHVIEQLRIKSREGSNVESVLYMNIMESAPIFMSLEATSSEMIREKIAGFLENPSTLRQKLEGQTEINYQRIFDLSPTEMMIPSDMGFPIVIEVHMPITFSLRGKMEVSWTSMVPSVSMNVRTLYAAQYTGWVGTICPFTKEFVATGTEEHSVINLPFDFTIELNPTEQKLNIRAKILSNVDQLDLLHFHVRPFVVHQKNWDLTPMTLSSNMKVIKSDTKETMIKKNFGDHFGLDLTSVLKTESPFTDKRSLFQTLRMFNYNPLNLLRFSWANTALDVNEMPSLRRHEYKLQYRPSQSQTREIEISVATGFATKSEQSGGAIQYHALKNQEGGAHFPYTIRDVSEESVHPRRQQQVRQILGQMEVESGAAITLRTTISFKGSRTHVINYILNLAGGAKGLQQKWSINLEGKDSNKFCMNGMVHLPNVPMWKVKEVRANSWDYTFKNTIGYGQDCTQSQVKIEGSAKVSEEQKEWSRESPEGKQLKRMEERNGDLAELSDLAQQVKVQASTLDTINYRIEFENVSNKVVSFNNWSIQVLKGIWWPYLKSVSPTSGQVGGSHSFTERVVVKLSPKTKTFDLKIVRDNEEVKFENVRVPYPFNYFFTSSVYQGEMGLGVKAVTGQSNECRLNKDWLKTFNKKTMKIPHFHDECFRLLSADCSHMKRWGVMVRSLGKTPESGNELKMFIKKSEIILTPSSGYSSYSKNIKVTIDGSEVTLNKQKTKTIVGKSTGQTIGTVMLRSDNTIVFKSVLFAVKFDGQMVDLEILPVFKNRVCGLCGTGSEQLKDALVGPQECIYSKPEVFAASYRVQSGSQSCKPLPQEIERELSREDQECAKYEVIPTKVGRSFEALAGDCTSHRHEIIEKSHEICLSQVPLTQCGAQCRPASEDALLKKQIGFTCMPKNRMAYHYVQKIHNQQVLSELKTLPTSFSLDKRMPRTCVPVHDF
uniref:Vitellogenin 2 n=1 Tax=Tigriopus kingsejongensis TaxID=1133412 RepID=A0A0U2RGD1_9MAXI|nr:vitellogenin 2 [Tigriopus kingsejongensis]